MTHPWSPSPGATPPTVPPPSFGPTPPASPTPRLPPRQDQPAPPTGGDPEPTPPQSPSPDARNAVLIALAVIAVVLLFALSFTWVVDRASDEVAGPTTVPSTVSPSPLAPPTTAPPDVPTTPPTTAPLPPPETVVIPELQQFVAAQRGLSYSADVPVALLSDEEFSERLLAALPPGTLETMLWELQVLGLVGTGPEALQELEALLVDNLIGLYSNGQIIVKGEERGPELDITIVHELTHALDDQNFGFDRPELVAALDESPFGLEAVVEGSAMSVEAAYAASIGVDYISPNEGGLFDGLLILPKYVFGEGYVQSLLASGGNTRIDEAFRSPPKTSKEVMQSELHLSGYTPTPVEPPPVPDGAEIIDEGLYGEVRFWQMFTQVLAPDEAFELASTWVGDWHVVWIDGLDQCVRVDAALATPEAARVFAEQLRAWAVSQEDAVVEELSSGLVRVTVCAPRPPPPPGSTSPA